MIVKLVIWELYVYIYMQKSGEIYLMFFCIYNDDNKLSMLYYVFLQEIIDYYAAMHIYMM